MTSGHTHNGFSLSFPATEIESRAGICAVAKHLSRQGVTETKAGDIQIALAEAVNNVVEHAYASVKSGNICIHCAMFDDILDICITDQGQPLRNAELPAGLLNDMPDIRSELPEGGFGWFLIRQLTSSVNYRRHAGRNHLILRFDLDPVTAEFEKSRPQ